MKIDSIKEHIRGVGMTPSRLAQLEQFVTLFQTYNQHTNLSAVREEETIWLKHIADSLAILPFEKLTGRVLDIGTGGGLPGIPLAVAQNDAEFILLDSVGKKIKACEHFAKEIGLTNVQTVHDRAEQLARNKKHAGKYDFVVSRAVAYLPVLLTWCKPFLAPEGKIILYKTPSDEELSDGDVAAKKLKLRLDAVHTYELAGQQRQFLVYKNAR